MQILSLASVPPQGTIYSPQGTRRVLYVEHPRQQPQWPAPKQAEKKYGLRKLRTQFREPVVDVTNAGATLNTSKTTAISAPTPKAETSEKEFKT
jgi:hypothetical protein